MDIVEESFSELPESVDPAAALEAALLVKRSGDATASWVRHDLPERVLSALSVMTATLIESMDTILESLGHCPSQNVVMGTDECRFFVAKVGGNAILVLVARRSTSESYLWRLAQQILSRIGAEWNSTDSQVSDSLP